MLRWTSTDRGSLSGRLRRRTGVMAVGALGVAALCGAQSAAEWRPATYSIRAVIAPGKPSAPEEQVELLQGPGQCTLRVSRTPAPEQGSGPTADAGAPGTARNELRTAAQSHAARATLERERCTPLWELVVHQQLDRVTLRERAGDVSDFGSRSLYLGWGATDERPAGERELHWIWPLEQADRERVAVLLERLGALARENAPGVSLAYFP